MRLIYFLKNIDDVKIIFKSFIGVFENMITRSNRSTTTELAGEEDRVQRFDSYVPNVKFYALELVLQVLEFQCIKLSNLVFFLLLHF